MIADYEYFYSYQIYTFLSVKDFQVLLLTVMIKTVRCIFNSNKLKTFQREFYQQFEH